MAIIMDGNTITALRLTDSSGAVTTKALSETGVIATPTETLTIENNGTYDVTNYASAEVNIPTEISDSDIYNSKAFARIVNYAFIDDSPVDIKINNPYITILKPSAFSYIYNGYRGGTVSIVLPNVITIGNNNVFSNIVYGTSSVSDESTRLRFVDLPSCKSISGNDTFTYTTYFDLILRNTDGIVALSSKNSFSSRSDITATIYVPSALLNAYETDTVWGEILSSCTNVSLETIEGSKYEGYYADGTSIY